MFLGTCRFRNTGDQGELVGGGGLAPVRNVDNPPLAEIHPCKGGHRGDVGRVPRVLHYPSVVRGGRHLYLTIRAVEDISHLEEVVIPVGGSHVDHGRGEDGRAAGDHGQSVGREGHLKMGVDMNRVSPT